jgi:hypothetical protein
MHFIFFPEMHLICFLVEVELTGLAEIQRQRDRWVMLFLLIPAQHFVDRCGERIDGRRADFRIL